MWKYDIFILQNSILPVNKDGILGYTKMCASLRYSVYWKLYNEINKIWHYV